MCFTKELLGNRCYLGMNDIKRIIIKIKWRTSVKNINYKSVVSQYNNVSVIVKHRIPFVIFEKVYNYRMNYYGLIYNKYQTLVGVLPKNY